MMKKIRMILMMVCLCGGLFIGLEASAETKYVYDQADLLTDEEELEFQSYAEVMKETWEMNFMVVTTDYAEGKSSMEYADDFYDAHFPEESEADGILYLLDMDNREIYLSTSGLAIRYLTDDRIDSILDEAFEYVAEGDYYGTFQAFFDETENYLYQGIPEEQYNYDVETGEMDYYDDSEEYSSPMRIDIYEFLFAFFAALITSVITVLIIKASYRLKKYKDIEYNAYTDGEIVLSAKSDRLINTFVTHRRIPRNDESSGGSRSGGSRSSVHTSSSGRSHGGGGRKF